MRGHEEPREEQSAAGDAREEDVGGVEGYDAREDVADEGGEELGVGGAVGTGEARGRAGALAPEEVFGGREDDDADEGGGGGGGGLVGEVGE